MTNHALGIWTCTQVAWQFRLISTRRRICNSLTKRNFKAGSWISRLKFAQKRRISRLCCSGSRKSKQPKRFSDYEESDLMMTSDLKWCYNIFWSSKLPSAVTRQKGEKLLHLAEDWRMFSAEDNWVLFKKRRLQFSHKHATGDWGQRGMKWGYGRSSHLLASFLFSTESERHRLTEKNWNNSLNASPATKAENFLSTVGKMKNIVAWLSTSSRVSWLQVWKQMHSLLSLPMSTSWW